MRAPGIFRPKSLPTLPRVAKQRLAALFFVAVMITGTIMPVASAYAAAKAPKQKNVAPIAEQEAGYETIPQVEPLAPVSEQVKSQTPKEGRSSKSFDIKNAKKAGEKINERTEQSRTYNLEGGGELTESTAVAQNYTDSDGKLKPIGQRPVRDGKYEEANKVSESFWERIWPGSPQPVGYKATEGSLEVYFETIGKGGIRVVKDGKELRFAPDTEEIVKPQLKEFDNGEPYILYQDVWPAVDLYYAYQGTSLKEYIRINKNTGQSSFKFNLEGAKAVKGEGGQVQFDGVFADLLVLGELSVNVNKQGPLKEAKPAYAVHDNGQTLAIEVDGKWLSNQGDDAFPMVIDPPIWDYTYIPGGYTGQFWAYKSDGYYCPSSNCNVNIGALNNNGLKAWRTMFVTPYEHIFGRQMLGAWIDMSMTNAAGWPGYYDNRTVWVTWAPCFGYGCIYGGAPHVSGVVGGSGTIDVTPLMNWLQTNNVHGGVLIAWGEEWHTTSYKQIHPLSVRLTTATNLYPSIPVPQVPSTDPNTEAVITTTQPMVGVSGSTDPNGDPVKYVYQLRSTNGVVLYQTDWMDANRLTIPEGLLQDGGSYAWSYAVWDGYWSSPWQNGGKFRVDLRTGKDKTSTYETLGPVSASLNNGNAYTSVESHGIKALDGNIGLSLNYNSPLASRPGLRASYYNNQNWSGTPVLRRTEATIDNNWSIGSPAQGVVGNDNFSAKYEGFFVAPATGAYYFGGSNDDYARVTVNSQQVYTNGGCYSGICYGGSINLTAGQTVSFLVEYIEATSPAYVRIFVKGAVSERLLPTEWLRTAPMPTEQNTGLTGHYYADNGSHDPAQLTNKLMTRQDPSVNFNWGTLAPIPNVQADNFFVRWEGYFTPPTTGNYTFGARADDGVRIKINGNTVMQNWAAGAFGLIYGSGAFLTAGVPVPISVEYFEVNGGAYAQLYAKGPSTPNGAIVEAQYLSPGAKLLPAGWNISADADGNLAYERLEVRQNGDVIMYDADGSTQLFTNTGSGFKPPANEDATLIRNANSTYNLTDTDGRVYVFNVDGTLRETQAPLDDLKPAAMKYNYAAQNGIPKLTEIVDGVDSARKGNLYYQGDSQCASPPSGFVAPPTSNLCAFITSDGQRTDFFYVQDSNGVKRLARVSMPGGANYDLGYDNNGMLTSIRDVLANDAMAAGVRADDETALSQIAYNDPLARATSVTAPAPAAGAVRSTHSLEYLPNKSKLHVSGATEPNGYSQYIEYDSLLRTTKACDIAALCGNTEWHATKDLALSTTDATGLKSTTIYDTEDRPIDSYGPAPAAWFGADRKPLAAYLSQVPRTQTNYDEGLVGPAVAYYGYKSGSLVGAPRLHTTGTVPENPGFLNKNWATSPITINTAAGETGFGFRATGRLRVPSTNTYYFSLWHNDGVRMYIDGQIVVNDWVNGAIRGSVGSKVLEAGKSYRFLLEYYDADGQSSGTDFYISPGTASTAPAYRYWSSYLKPAYNLATSTKTFDSTIGDTTTTTNYGPNPELGLAQSATVDPTGLNLTTSSTYETQGATGSYLRQTSKTLPGGTATAYAYYNATETRDNPCTPETETHKQAGFMRLKTEADPDAGGSQTPRTSEVIYDDAGRTVASRFNSDDWSCVTYDARGRTVQTAVPTINNRPGRTVTTNYNYQGSPLKVQVVDSVAGTTVSEIDLLGRSVSATDTFGNVSTAAYDSLGRITTKTTPLGTETYTYDTYSRVTEYKHNNTKYATITYDQYSRVQDITYDQATGSGSGGPTFENIRALTNGWATEHILSAGGGNYDGTPNAQNTFTFTGLTAAYDSTKSTQFSASVDSGTQTGNTIQARVSYDFTADGSWDRVETYNAFATDNVSGYQAYTQATGIKTATGTFANLQNGSVKVETWSASGSGQSGIKTPISAATAEASTVTLPYGAGGSPQGTLKLEQIKRDALQRNAGAVFRFSNAAAFDETVTRTQSGIVIGYADVFGGNTVANTYAYDKAGRLTQAVVDKNKYDYSYTAPSAATCNQSSANLNSHKNSNRTSYTLTNTVTSQVLANSTYCYDQADRLLTSSDAQLGTPTYDDHGNTAMLAGNGTAINFTYDASDSNTAIEQGANKVIYVKTANGSVLRKKEYTSSTLTKSYRYLVGGAVMQTCSLTDDNDCTTTDTYLPLPGGTTLTLSPTNPEETKRTIYTLKNFHGDTAITAKADGTPSSSVYLYEPFGMAAPSSTFQTNSDPQNSTNESMGWAANPNRKLASSNFTIPIIQMGARVYLPGAGRFLQVDPIEGGTLNAYVYPANPINFNDYSGKATCSQLIGAICGVLFPNVKGQVTARGPVPGLPVASAPRTASRGRTAPKKASPTPRQTTSPDISGFLKSVEAEKVKQDAKFRQDPGERFDYYKAGSTAVSWYYIGALAGGVAGCAVGALITAGAAAAACMVYGAAWAGGGGIVGGGIGFFEGGYDSPRSNYFDWGSDQLINPWTAR